MMIDADSFVGRVLAVISRRSPGFRPPQTPRHQSSWPYELPAIGRSERAGGLLTNWLNTFDLGSEVTWSPALRLEQRHRIIPLLDNVAELQHTIEGVCLITSRWGSHNLAGQPESESWEDLRRKMLTDLGHAAHRARAAAREAERSVLLEPSSWSFVQVSRSLSRWADTWWQEDNPPVERLHFLCHRVSVDLSPLPVRLDRMLSTLHVVAADFAGADLRDVDVTGIDLDGVVWDANTLWPQGWGDRLLLMSSPEPSGRFVVRLASAGGRETRAQPLTTGDRASGDKLFIGGAGSAGGKTRALFCADCHAVEPHRQLNAAERRILASHTGVAHIDNYLLCERSRTVRSPYAAQPFGHPMRLREPD